MSVQSAGTGTMSPGWLRTLRELSRSYLTVSKDLTRVMNRLKGLYRNWAIPCGGQQVCSPRQRAAWLEKLREAGVRRRAERLYEQLDFLMRIRKETRTEMLAESRKHPASQLLQQIPGWACRRAAAANTGTPGDNCSMPKSDRRCAALTSTTIMI